MVWANRASALAAEKKYWADRTRAGEKTFMYDDSNHEVNLMVWAETALDAKGQPTNLKISVETGVHGGFTATPDGRPTDAGLFANKASAEKYDHAHHIIISTLERVEKKTRVMVRPDDATIMHGNRVANSFTFMFATPDACKKGLQLLTKKLCKIGMEDLSATRQTVRGV